MIQSPFVDTALWDRVTLKTEEQRSGGVSLTITNSDCGQQQPMVLHSGKQQTIVGLDSGQAEVVVGAGSRIPSLPNEEITPVNHGVGISAAFCQRNCRERYRLVRLDCGQQQTMIPDCRQQQTVVRLSVRIVRIDSVAGRVDKFNDFEVVVINGH